MGSRMDRTSGKAAAREPVAGKAAGRAGDTFACR